jgi:hypothetical protein
MKKSVTFLALLFYSLLFAQEPVFEWATSIGGTNAEQAIAITVDLSGNVYTAGIFNSTADLDPSLTSIQNFTAFGTNPNNPDVYIMKQDANGNLIWVKQIGGNGVENVFSICLDSQGNVYTVGSSNGTADFNPSTTAVFNLSQIGFIDCFISKLSNDGDFVWAKRFGGSQFNIGNAIKTDVQDNVYVVGNFQGTTDFDPNPTVTNSLSSMAEYDVFISKFDSLGNFSWVKRFGGSSYQFGYAIDFDSQGNIYTTGSFQETVDFDPSTTSVYNLTSGTSMNALSNIFVSKLDSNGNFVWAKQMGGNVLSSVASSLKIDSLDNVITTGYFTGSGDFDPNAGVFEMTTIYRRSFISKLTSDGDFIWAKNFSGNDANQGKSITVDSSNNIYVTGKFLGTADFDPSTNSYPISSNSVSNEDVYFSKLNTDGDFVWARSISGPNSFVRLSSQIVVDNSLNIYTVGNYADVCDFDPNSGIYNLSANGSTDSFVLKFNQNALGVDNVEIDKNFKVYPNPTNGIVNINSNTPIYLIEIYDLIGKKIKEISFDSNSSNIDISDFNSGVYLLKLYSTKGVRAHKILKN